ncbi:TonB-dependent receptor [Gilvimarinus sp. SDUM040013]|uniref:TonB-dependent receptor n=1 Tax=Gilvimarinus gilvus TaxID=3058038 RepID=A0ABU4RYX2_9GAMM|nr:TonB-dependent receptor [Gilvimarinus sp. SDUM040013]MDO3387751.1 TonB-dependent receptor [Gilvimarinus sp. SDUM040013]MDX6848808.1 TonB-dependent receptor [Gilvimarinus sp. SDUM040013]
MIRKPQLLPSSKRWISTTCASSLVLCALGVVGPAMAQETSAEEEFLEEVVVTGVRASIETAQAIKRDSTVIVDSIVATDIGKLPDVNVAETLQRISGVQISRNRGEGSDIAIRGLTQIRTEVNGRDSFSTTNGRSLSFEDVPSELLAGIDVYKNPAANQIEGGIGGVVDLRTRMPFDADGRLISGSISTTHYDVRDDEGYDISGLYSDRWETSAGEFGFLVNLSFSEAVFREDRITVEPFFTRTDIPGFEGESVEVASGGGISSWNGDRERTGAAVAFQWAPNDDMELYATYLTSQYEFYDPQTGFFAYGAGEGGSLTPVEGSYSFDEDGNLLTGGFVSPPTQSFTRDSTRDSQTTDYAVGFKWSITPALEWSSDLQYVDSETTYRDVTGFGSLDGGSTFYLDLTGELPEFMLEPAGFMDDPTNYFYQAMMNRTADNVGDELALRSDLEWDFDEGGLMRSFTAGVRYTNKDIETSDSGFVWSAISGPPWDGSDVAQADYEEFPDYYAPDPHQDSFWRGEGSDSLFGSHFVVSPELMTQREDALAVLGGLNPQSGAPTEFSEQNQLNVQNEETQAIYGMLDFGMDDFALPFDGNVGVRVVKTNVTADGVQTLTYREPSDTGTEIQYQTPIVVEQDYTEVLPSLNLRFFLTENLYWRIAASKGLSRPSFNDLAANFTLSENYIDDDSDPTTPPVYFDSTGSGGNPGLEPLTVDQIDTAIEWYYNDGSMMYATLFHKDVKNFTQNGVYDADFDVPGKGTETFEVTAPVNGENGTIQGYEIGIQHFFDSLPAPFDGFGIQANYTYVDSEAPSPSATDTEGNPLLVPLEGLSENSYNLVGLFEKGSFSARLAYNWRDDWVITTAGNGTGNLPIYNDEYGQLDGSVSYDFSDNFSISLDAVNMLDETNYTYQAFPNRPRDYSLNDRRYRLRLSMKF